MNNSRFPHHRRSIRLKEYDYSSEGGYFITIITHNRERTLGNIINDEMYLNQLGAIIREEWFKTAKIREYVELFEDEFVVMPNHIHGIIWIIGNQSRGTARCAPTDNVVSVEQFGKPVAGSIPTIVRAFKSAATKRVNLIHGKPGKPVFQRNYYEHIITTDREYEQIVEYIDSNPRNWLNDDEYIGEPF